MIVVANTSPLINLAAIGRLELLHQLYGKIIIPPAVHYESVQKGAGEANAIDIASAEWIEIKKLSDKKLSQVLQLELDEGEAQAIALAVEINAAFLIIDERKGREAASRLGIKRIGLLGTLVEAKHKGLIDAVKPILNELISVAGFWIDGRLFKHVCKAAGE